MVKWIILCSILVGGLTLWYLFQHLQDNVPSTVIPVNAVTLVHAFKDGVHRYDGALRLPHSCYAVDTNTFLNPTDPTTLVLTVKTKDMLLDKKLCLQIPTIYPFEIVTDAPQNVKVIFRLNDIDVPITFVETEWQSPRGTMLNLENQPQ